MSSRARRVSVPNLAEFIRVLHSDGSLYYDMDRLSNQISLKDEESTRDQLKDIESRIGKPFPVVDPRYSGYEFPSYTFIETERNLENGSKAQIEDFNRPERALLLGTVLGDYDLIHRRVDTDRWENANFAKWAKDKLSYFEEFETYSIFQIARWYGKDIGNPITRGEDIRPLKEIEKEVLNYVSENPDFIEYLESPSNLNEEDTPPQLIDYGVDSIKNSVRKLNKKDIYLGSSITYDINNTPWKSVIMGLSLGPKTGTTSLKGYLKENMSDEMVCKIKDNIDINFERDDLDLLINELGERIDQSIQDEVTVEHTHVINQLQDLDNDKINKFNMPFIVSGIGQSWADILLEFRVNNVHHMDEIAQEIRDIDYVDTTQSYIMTDVLFHSHANSIAQTSA